MAQGRILIVEDEPGVRAVVRRFLQGPRLERRIAVRCGQMGKRVSPRLLLERIAPAGEEVASVIGVLRRLNHRVESWSRARSHAIGGRCISPLREGVPLTKSLSR